MYKLKSCPFCGGEMRVVQAHVGTYFIAHEKRGNCAIIRTVECASEQSAITAWNTRTEEQK